MNMEVVFIGGPARGRVLVVRMGDPVRYVNVPCPGRGEAVYSPKLWGVLMFSHWR